MSTNQNKLFAKFILNGGKQDMYPNDKPANCLKNVKYNLKNSRLLSIENFQYVAAHDIIAAKIGEGKDACDLMQYALATNQKDNVNFLSKKFFCIHEYADYVKTLPEYIQKNMAPLFQKRDESERKKHDTITKH